MNIKLEPTDGALRWLHLTDLHVGKVNEVQQTALRSLVESIEKFAESKPFDLVLLTGDLAFSGKKGEFEEFRKLIVDPLRAHSLFAQAIFFAVPGNHDLDCDVGYPPSWAALGTKRQDSFFNLDEAGVKTRSPRSPAFKEYRDFTISADIYSVDPTVEPAKLITVEKGGKTYSFVLAVTAFFSDKDVEDYLKAPAPTHAIRTVLQQANPDAMQIVLSHHPIDWFMPESERQLYSLLVEKNVLYINGHEHRIKSRFGGRGLTTIGLGAAYQGKIDGGTPKPLYRNSFSICEVTDALHIKIVSWDSEHGQWRPEQNLPGDFIERSNRLTDGYWLSLPSTKLSEKITRPHSELANALRTNVDIEKCIWLADNEPGRWVKVLHQIGQLRGVGDSYNLPTQTKPAGHTAFRVSDQRGKYLVWAISGSGDILNYEQLQNINTELDKQDYTGGIIATLGSLSEEAHTLASQLASKKNIVILEKERIVREILRAETGELRQTILSLDPASLKATMIITGNGIALLVQERTNESWFKVINDEGLEFPESDELVAKLRDEMPHLRKVRYFHSNINEINDVESVPLEPVFVREEYLRKSFDHFDDVKYAPLAALGFKFRNASLSNIYVSASAGVNGTSKPTQNLSRAIGEFLDSLNLGKAQRDQLESQLRSKHGIQVGAEVGAARQLYQRYNSAVVMGDPGSGKTCFVKHEILAYCRPPVENGSWYSSHLPVYVSLAEAARLLNENTSLLDICEILAARRGIVLPQSVLLKTLSEGQAAFFFDGLDEVGYIDMRISLMAQVSALVNSYSARGNRFVLASRPAALQPVEIPEGLTYLQLKGLTEDEMRVLASRVLTIRLGEGESDELTADESELVERLLEDSKNSPGIARIARNPLLLTLLVLIYANSGSISARRHLIYTQAIKTLVSVRGRDTREQQISEADLRTRLGALAVAIFSREIAELPRRSEALMILRPLLELGRKPDSNFDCDSTCNAFLQEVAEATGLLSIHPEDAVPSNDLITFMHYSFLEYYAAAGLLSRNFIEDVPKLASNPRWKDVITLLFGILSEQGDVTPLLKAILENPSKSEEITQYKLLLSLESASECDVPPEAAQRFLLEKLLFTVSVGAGRYSSKLREAIASKLDYFLQGSGPILEGVLIEGLADPDPSCAAAFADLLARLGNNVTLSRGIVDAFQHSLRHSNSVTRTAVLFAVERRMELRTPSVLPIIKDSLKGSLAEKNAALKTVTAIPAYFESSEQEITSLLDDTNPLISSSAAQCILTCGFEGVFSSTEGGIREKVLTRLANTPSEAEVSLPGITLDRQKIEMMIVSGTEAEAELAARYTPMIQDDAPFIYQVMMKCARRKRSTREVVACFDALRASPRALDLLTIADTDHICNQLEAGERNLRIAAIRLLGEMPDDEQVVLSLLNHLTDSKKLSQRSEEMTECARALAKHAKTNQRLRNDILTAVYKNLPTSPDHGFGDADEQHHLMGLLLVCESLGSSSDEKMAGRLLVFAESYKTPDMLRRQALRVFGRTATPNLDNLNTLLRLLGKNDIRYNESVYSAVSSFVQQCQRRVEYVRSVNSKLAALRDALCDAWRREVTASVENIDLSGAKDIRDALIGVEGVLVQYEEFAERAQLRAA